MDPPPAAPPTPNQEHQWFCHECQWEGIPVRAPDPTCARCQGTFLEEIEPESSDDPRNFDQDDGEGPGAGEAVLEFGDGAQGGPVFRFVLPGGAAALNGGGTQAPGGGPGGDDAGNGGGFTGLLNMFGNIMAGVGAGQGGGRAPNGRAARWALPQAEDDPGDPDEEVAGGGDGQHGGAPRQGEGQVPIRNLATFLGEAFGAPAPHPADHARNNPYAEGGHDDDDGPPAPPGQAHPPNDPFAALAAAAAAGGAGGGGLNYLVSLLNAFGEGPLVGNRGDYAFGEGNFQQILNDLMEQAAGRAGPQPATKEIIDNLPRRLVDQEYLDAPTTHDCVICQDAYKLDDPLLTLPCKFSHAFHTDCIVPWLENSGTCPTCRFPLVPQPVDGVMPAQEAGGGGDGAEPSGSGAREDRAEGTSSGNGAPMSGSFGGSGSLPGSWPVDDDGEAERTRARSRNREREQREAAAQHEEDEMPVLEDLD